MYRLAKIQITESTKLGDRVRLTREAKALVKELDDCAVVWSVRKQSNLDYDSAKHLFSLHEMIKWNRDALKVDGINFNTQGFRGCGAMNIVVYNT